jgi:hypothetical protein
MGTHHEMMHFITNLQYYIMFEASLRTQTENAKRICVRV